MATVITVIKELDSFTIQTNHGTFSGSNINYFVEMLEQELNITIYNHDFTVEIDIFENELEKQEEIVKDLRTKFDELKKKSKDKS